MFPRFVKAGEPVTASWANDVVATLRSSQPPNVKVTRKVYRRNEVSGDSYIYPFKLSTEMVGSELRLYVSWGIVSAMTWTDGDDYPCTKELPCTFNSNNLKDDIYNGPGTDGYEVLSAETSYGVWVRVDMGVNSITNPSGNEFSLIKTYVGTGSGCTIFVSTTYKDPTAGPSLSVAEGGDAFFFLGLVGVDASSVASIQQWRRSDIVVPMSTLPENLVIVSTDGGNTITTGTDGGAYKA